MSPPNLINQQYFVFIRMSKNETAPAVTGSGSMNVSITIVNY